MTTITANPLKWHGGKSYLAMRIIALMPPHLHYVEPYFGGGAVLLAKDPEGISEVINDVNCELMRFWTILRSEELFPQFVRLVQGTPFSEDAFRTACANLKIPAQSVKDQLHLAYHFFVACRQSMSGRMKDFAPLSRTRTRRGMNEQASAWMNCVDSLPEVHARLRRVVILNRDAIDVIRQQDGEQTLFYLDPPYLHETRATTGEYDHEMTREQHVELLDALLHIKGKFMLSGYDSQLYRSAEKNHGWKRHTFDLPNNAAGGDTKRRMTEIVWCNFKAGGAA